MRPLLFPLALLVLLLVACQPPAQPTTLKVGLLPIVDVLPMYVAEREGYFARNNVQAELVLFASALERDAAIQAGQIDLQLNDLVSAALLNKDAERIKVVRLTYQGSPAKAMMLILAAPNSAIRTPQDLKGVPIGVSGNTVIEYATDRMLREAGLAPTEIEKTEVTRIPVRAEMLAKNQIQAATLPEPLASLAVQQGARVVLDDAQTGIGQSVLSVRTEVLQSNADAIRRFLQAYEQAVDAINAAPEKYRDLLIEQARVPESLKESFGVPRYPKASVPSERDVQAVVDWMVSKGLLAQPLGYDRLVRADLLPR